MVKAVVGANWGDEGKGKITDMLAKEADIIVRFQGGANMVNLHFTHFRQDVFMDIQQASSVTVLH